MAGELSLVLSAEASYHASLPALQNILPEACPPAMYPLQSKVLGGYLGCGSQLVWRACGPTVEVLDSSSGTRLASWTFGAILRSLEAKVLSVCGVGCSPGTITHILCGVDRGPEASPRGLVAVLSLTTSKIVRAFLFPNAIVEVSTITGGPAWVDVCTLHPALRHCSPLVVVASDLPSLHLLDLALDVSDIEVSDEVSPASLVSLPSLSGSSASRMQHRLSALRERMHLSATLMDGSVSGTRFCLLGPNDAVLCQLPAESVAVTALLYVPQVASLAIGYNFGAFQLYNLCSLAIDCASPYEEGVPGVVSFAYQEPENDPRNCVYLWLCRSVTPDAFQSKDSDSEGGAVCTLYSMTYEKREWIEGHGLSYQGLTTISPRFEFEADGSPQGGSEGCPTVLFTSHTITRPSPATSPPPLDSCSPSLLLGATDDEGNSGHVSDLSLCLFGWYSRVRDERGRLSTQHFVALFDINQWYQAQMPGSVRLTPGKLCPYFSFHQLNRVPCGVNERVLAASPLTTCNITRHMAPAGSSERDWYPASLSYGVGVLSSSGTAWYQCRSSQQSCLRWLLAQGPAAVIMCPDEAVARCSFAGLLSAEPDLPSPRLHSKKSDRETVLEVCLSQHLLSVLSECVSEFSEGRFASLGCTLPSFLHWAWGRVTDTKADIDGLLSRLFSCGDAQLTPEQLQRLHHNLTVLGCLRSVLVLCAQHTPTTTRHAGGGRGEVSAYATVVSLLHQHLTVTLWFQHCQLLPEIDPSLAMEDSTAVPYPALPLAQIYRNRRQDISELSPHVGGKDLLMIDLLMEELGVKSIADWGEGGPPVYPPPSLQALLNIYLLPDIDISLKHRIVQYLFLDLSSILTNGFVSAVEQLIKFPASAKLSPSIIKLTQAFWLLDQKDFQSAVDLFLDPLVVRTDITPAQHRRIIRALLCQNEAQLALCYSEGRRPPHQQLEDVQLQLFVLLANGRVREAFHYQRSHATVSNSDRLLQHLLHGCELYGRLQEVLQLPLLPNEESAFMKFLQDSEQPLAKHILTVACLRSYKYSSTGPINFPEDKQKLAVRSALLNCYSTHLQASQPPVTKSVNKRSDYSGRQPLSACLRQAALSPHTKSKTFQARFSSASQQEQPQQFEPFTPFRSRAERLQKRRDAELSKNDCTLLFPSRVLEGSRHSGLADASTRVSSLSNVSAHITALLSTPPAPRRARPSLLSRAPSTNDSTIASTPQSILKVRSLLKRPMSPCSASGDLSVPHPPRSTPRPSLASKVLEEDGGASDSSCLTPKQLRFALPTPPLEASNDAPSVEGGADEAVKAPALVDGDSDDHSDLDVQLEPYINLRAKVGASNSALYEEQESWELMGDQSLPTEPQPSFSGVLQQASKSEQSSTVENVKSSSAADEVDDHDSTMSDANENYFSFESEDVNEKDNDDQPNVECVEEQETDDEERQSSSEIVQQEIKAEDEVAYSLCDQNKGKLAEKSVVEPDEGETLMAVSSHPCPTEKAPSSSITVSSVRSETQEELHSEDVSVVLSKSHSLVEEQSSQDAKNAPLSLDSKAENLGKNTTGSKLQQLLEISAEDVQACLEESSPVNQPITKPLSFSGLISSNELATSKRRRDSSSSVSDEETGSKKPPSKTAKITTETSLSIVSTQAKETMHSLQFSYVEDEPTPTAAKRSGRTSFLEQVVSTSSFKSLSVKKNNTPATPLLLSSETEEQIKQTKSSESRDNVTEKLPTFHVSPPQEKMTTPSRTKSSSLKKQTPSREVVKERIREVVSRLNFSDSDENSSDETDLTPIATGSCSSKSLSNTGVQDVDGNVGQPPMISEHSDEETAEANSPHLPENTSKKVLSTALDTQVSIGSVASSEPLSSKTATPKRSRRLSGIDTTNIIIASSATPLRNRSSSRNEVSNILEPPAEFANSASRPSTPLRRSGRRPVGESPLLVGDAGKLEADQTVEPQASSNIEDIGTKNTGITAIAASGESEQLKEIPTTSSLVVGSTSDSVRQGEIKRSTEDTIGEEDKDSSSSNTNEDTAVTQLSVDKEVENINSRSPSRRGRLSSLGEVSKLHSPATPLRRSSRRSVTPSKFGTPVLQNVPEKAEEKTPEELTHPPDNNPESTQHDVSITDSEAPVGTPSSARKSRRRSVDLGTPIKSPAVAPSTPLRRSRRGTTPVSDSLQVIEEVEGETIEVESQPETTPSKLQTMRNRRKSRRSIAAPDLQPIDEDQELITTSPPVAKTPQSKQKSKQAIVTPSSEKKDSSTSRRSIRMRSLAGATSDSETTELESTKSRRRSSVSSASAKKEPHIKPSLSSMKLLKTDLSEDEESLPEKNQRPSRRRSRLPLDTSVVKVAMGLDTDDDVLEEESEPASGEFADHPDQEGDNEDDLDHGEEEEAKGTRLRPLRTTTKQTSEETLGRRQRTSERRASVASSGASGKKVGIKRSRQSMRLIASETEEDEDGEEEAAADVASRPKRQRRSSKTD